MFYMNEIQFLIFELYTNKAGGGQSLHKTVFMQVLSFITTWKGCTLKILTFIFWDWFMQCPTEGSRVHSFRPFPERLIKSATTQKRSRHSTDTVPQFQAKSPQETASKGLVQGPYVAARAGFEPTTLQ